MVVADRPVRTGTLGLMPKQALFIESDAKYKALIGGVGSGKTEGGGAYAVTLLSQYPGIRGMATAPTFSMLRDATLVTMKELLTQLLGPEGDERDEKAAWRYLKADKIISLKNGSSLIFQSTQEPEHLRGPTLGFFWMDEAALGSPNRPDHQEEAFKVLQARLRQPTMPCVGFITTTPKGFNWVYRKFVEEKRRNYQMWQVSSRENWFVPKDYVPDLESDYEGAFALQEIEGQFVIVGGTAFFAADRLQMMLKETEEPQETRKGAISIWKKPVVAAKYIAGGDLAWGRTGAYSCLTILDYQTGEQVAEIHGRLDKDEMAQVSVDLCKEYNDAFVGMENNNEGQEIVNKMVDLGYRKHMYYQDWKEKRRVPGWRTHGTTTRPLMLGELEEAVRLRGIIPRCRDAVEEMMMFERNDAGIPHPIQGRRSDHVMSLAIAWQMRKYARFYTGMAHKLPISY